MSAIAHLLIQLDADGKISIQSSGDVAALYHHLAQALTQGNSSAPALPQQEVTLCH